MHLRHVLRHVVQLPDVFVEGRARSQAIVIERTDRMEGHRLPSVVVEGPRPEHLEVLCAVLVGFELPSLPEHVAEADAVEMRLGDPLDLGGRIDADQLEHGREDVDRVGIVSADHTGGRPHARGHPDDAGVGDTSLVHLALPALERGVPSHGPSPGVVAVAQRPADLVDAPIHLTHAGALEVRQPTLVDGALLATLGAGAIVRDDDHHRVVGVTEVGNEVEHAPDLLVRIGQVGGEALHEAPGERPLPVVEAVPARDPRGPW